MNLCGLCGLCEINNFFVEALPCSGLCGEKIGKMERRRR